MILTTLSKLSTFKKNIGNMWISCCHICSIPLHTTNSTSFATEKVNLCTACQASLPLLTTHCISCAKPLAIHTQRHCGACQKNPPLYEKVVTPFHYAPPLQPLIGELKFAGQLHRAKLLGKLLLPWLEEAYKEAALPQYLIPIPLHKKRLRQRGYNQALEIAKPLARSLKLPLKAQLLTRVKDTQAQARLRLKTRQHNVKQAFSVTKPLHGQHIALLDDVMTTGHTINAACHALKKAGCSRIDVWCVTRA